MQAGTKRGLLDMPDDRPLGDFEDEAPGGGGHARSPESGATAPSPTVSAETFIDMGAGHRAHGLEDQFEYAMVDQPDQTEPLGDSAN